MRGQSRRWGGGGSFETSLKSFPTNIEDFQAYDMGAARSRGRRTVVRSQSSGVKPIFNHKNLHSLKIMKILNPGIEPSHVLETNCVGDPVP